MILINFTSPLRYLNPLANTTVKVMKITTITMTTSTCWLFFLVPLILMAMVTSPVAGGDGKLGAPTKKHRHCGHAHAASPQRPRCHL